MFFLIPLYFVAAGTALAIFGGAAGGGTIVSSAIAVKLATGGLFRRGEGIMSPLVELDLSNTEDHCASFLRLLASNFKELEPYCKGVGKWQIWILTESERETLVSCLQPLEALYRNTLEEGWGFILAAEDAKALYPLLNFLEAQIPASRRV